MDKTPENPSQRRSQKRPHSPQDESPAPSDPKISATESESVLQSGAKRDKLLRLLGGKKRKNETAASKWLERVRTREDELKVSTELESQFNESLTHKLTGASRRHLGIGFKEEPPSQPPTLSAGTDSSNNNSGVPTSGDLASRNSAHPHAPQSVVGSLSNRANVPSLSSRGLRMGQRAPSPGYGHPLPYSGAYGTGPPNMMAPPNYNYPAGYPPAPGYMSSPTNYGYGMPYPGQYIPPTNMGFGYQGKQSPLPPPPPPPPPSEPEDSKPPEPAPKSKSAFYAQFKKAS